MLIINEMSSGLHVQGLQWSAFWWWIFIEDLDLFTVLQETEAHLLACVCEDISRED